MSPDLYAESGSRTLIYGLHGKHVNDQLQRSIRRVNFGDEMYMAVIVLVSGFVLSISTTILLIPVVRRIALSRGWVDHPDAQRKLHGGPVPPIGGVAIAAGFAMGLLYISLVQDTLPFEYTQPSIAVLIGLGAMVGAGLYDDIHGLSFKGKLFIQTVVACFLVGAGYQIDVSHLPFVGADPFGQTMISIPLTVLWIVGITNAVNLLDGLDGLAGGVVLIAFIGLAAAFGVQGDFGVIVFAVLIAGSLLGFLVHNFNPASIFMGDSGSLFLGCLLAVYSLSGTFDAGSSGLLLLVPVLALGLPLVDTGMSIIRRLTAGKSICAADRDHIHHRLLRHWTQRQTVLILYGVALWFGMAAVLVALLSPAFIAGVLALTIVACGAGLRLLGYLGSQPHLQSAIRLDRTRPTLHPLPIQEEAHGNAYAGVVEEKISLSAEGDFGVVVDRPYSGNSLRTLSLQN